MKKLKFIPILLVISIFTYFGLEGYYDRKYFYETMLHHKVIKRDNWQLRATEFYLENEIEIDSFGIPDHMFDLKVGDSIYKKSNSVFFRVYRKDDIGAFKLIHYYKYFR